MSERIPFIAYAEDCLVHAELELAGRRLTDYLNGQSQLTLHNVALHGHADGMIVTAEEFDLRLDEILAVEAAGWRGHPDKRLRTRTRRTDLGLGPYRVLGRLHGPPGADALRALHMRPQMVPLTDVTIAFPLNGQTIMRDVDTLIVNRLRIDSLLESDQLLSGLPLTMVLAPVSFEATGRLPTH